jgi:hypothetical protein
VDLSAFDVPLVLFELALGVRLLWRSLAVRSGAAAHSVG